MSLKLGIWAMKAVSCVISISAFLTQPELNTRFLIDNEVIDKDIPAIEALAAQYGVPTEDFVVDGDGDWFIDLPPGETLELPTGQVGDSGLFEIEHPEFPFGEPGNPTMEDFLNYNDNAGDLSKGRTTPKLLLGGPFRRNVVLFFP